MADPFASYATPVTGSGSHHFQIVPSDTEDLPTIPRAISCEGDGTIVIRDVDGTDLPYTRTVGQLVTMRAVRVLATGTTGTWYGVY